VRKGKGRLPQRSGKNLIVGGERTQPTFSTGETGPNRLTKRDSRVVQGREKSGHREEICLEQGDGLPHQKRGERAWLYGGNGMVDGDVPETDDWGKNNPKTCSLIQESSVY